MLRSTAPVCCTAAHAPYLYLLVSWPFPSWALFLAGYCRFVLHGRATPTRKLFGECVSSPLPALHTNHNICQAHIKRIPTTHTLRSQNFPSAVVAIGEENVLPYPPPRCSPLLHALPQAACAASGVHADVRMQEGYDHRCALCVAPRVYPSPFLSCIPHSPSFACVTSYYFISTLIDDHIRHHASFLLA